MRQAMTIVTTGALVLVGLVGCAQSEPSSSPTSQSSSSDFKACMVADQGGFNDKSFNQSSYEGLQKAVAELGIQAAEAETKTTAEIGPALATLVDQDCDLIVTVGVTLAAATRDSAQAHSDVDYALVDSTLTDANGTTLTLDNVRPLLFNTAEADFQAGYLAAATSQTGVVATFGGQAMPPVTLFMDGFVDGVTYYNQQKGASVRVLGWDKESQTGSFVGDFTNTEIGRQLTEDFIAQGADIVHPVAGLAGVGTLEAVRAAGDVYVIWVDSDGTLTNPEYSDIILTSVIKNLAEPVYDTIQLAQAGRFSAHAYVGDLENGGVSLAPFHDLADLVSADTQAELDQIKQDIIDGTIVVDSPSTPVS
ncbi:MAG: BMP family ABC transporter substrate-binding protein [Propionibacteriaceae bacterium]|jgi:basic membrane protein A|nr:BMP family ABC transporter substrate-binding protein [Propionibacteriaceae bacterium]